MKGAYNIMLYINDLDRLIAEIKTDVRFIERYIQDMEEENITIDTCSLEIILQNLSDNINQLYILTNPYY